jgi:hypothetical protein
MSGDALLASPLAGEAGAQRREGGVSAADKTTAIVFQTGQPWA